MGNPIDLLGKQFGRLTVYESAPDRVSRGGSRKKAWRCRCKCGNNVTATTQDLRRGDVRSCGCLKRELTSARLTVHGGKGSHLYNVWKAMRRRCSDIKQKDYHNYGGRGISVCSEWNDDFSKFREWSLANGYNESLTIDRIDVNGNYEPSNCRWVTMKEQSNNRTTNVIVQLNGEKHTIKEWSEITGISYQTLYMRLRTYGWDPHRALSTQ